MKTMYYVTSLAVLVSFQAIPALAEGVGTKPENPAWRNECGTCHVAYPPGLLTAPDWRKLMGGLERHFGTDASLDFPNCRVGRDRRSVRVWP